VASNKPLFSQDNILELGSKVGNFLDPSDASDDAGMFETVKQHIFGGMEESALDGTDRYKATVLSVSRYAPSSGVSEALAAVIGEHFAMGIRPRFLVRARVDTLHSHLPDPCQYINAERAPDSSTKRDIATLLHPVFVAEVNSGIIPNDGTNMAGTALPKPTPGDKIWVRFAKGPSAGVMRGGLYVGYIQKSAPGYNQYSSECDLSALTALDGGAVTSSVFSYNDASANECDPELGGAQCTMELTAADQLTAFIEALGQHAADNSFPAPVVGSTYRSVESQVNAVAGNWQREGTVGGTFSVEAAKAYVTRLYPGAAGEAYHAAFSANHTNGVVSAAGKTAAAAAEAVQCSSDHLTNPSPAMDMRMNSTLDSLFQSFLGELPKQSVMGVIEPKWGPQSNPPTPDGKTYTVRILSEVDHRHVTVK